MRIKRTAKGVAIFLLLLLSGYTGVCCGAILNKALHQPYLISAAGRWDFTGFYIMSICYGALCLLCVALLIGLAWTFKKKKG